MTPQMRLDNAKRSLSAARELCAHWDNEADESFTRHDCCYDVADASAELRLARKAIQP